MIDVNKITSTLAKLPDQQLQQYAQMHKNDPYIMALAMSESNRRKELRAAGQGAAQEQPKVVDQMVAEMAPQQMPEDMGIGQLPAGDMNFAGGGIVAFADGGDVERYQVGGVTKATPEFMRFLKQMNMDWVEFSAMDPAGKAHMVEMFEQPASKPSSAAPAQTAPSAQGASKSFTAGKAAAPYVQKAGSAVKAGAVPVVGAGLSAAQGMSEIDPATQFLNDPNVPAFEKAKQFTRTAARTALPYAGGVMGSGIAPIAGTVGGAALGTGLAAMIDPEGEALRRYRAVNEPSKAPPLADIRSQLNRADAATYARPGVDNAPAAAGPSTGTAPGASPRAAASSVLSPSTLASTSGGRGTTQTGQGLPDIFSPEGIRAARAKFMGNDDYEIGAMRNQLVEINSRANARVENRLAERRKEIAEEGDIYKDRSDRLVARGKRLEAQENQNTGLAFLNAGLAIMSTPGGLATALGKGAQVGTAQYAAGLDKLRAAQERLDDAKERIDELRLNRKDLNAREIRGLEKDRDSALADSEKAIFGFAKDVYNLNRSDATKMFDKYMSAQEKKYEQDQATRRTLATINASNDSRTKQLWAGLMQKHGNDPVAAAREYNTIEAGDKTNIAAEKLVQDRVGEWEKANKMTFIGKNPAEQTAILRAAEQRIRNDIYTQLKLTPTMGAGASGNSGFIFRGVEPAQ